MSKQPVALSRETVEAFCQLAAYGAEKTQDCSDWGRLHKRLYADLAAAEPDPRLRGRTMPDRKPFTPNENDWLDRIQCEVYEWERTRLPYGYPPDHHPMFGVAEEVGELAHHLLKHEQGIRPGEDHNAGAQDAVGDTVVFLAALCNRHGWNLRNCIERAWSHAKQRDHTKPVTRKGEVGE